MQRRVAGLPPLAVDAYNSKVLERRAEITRAETPREWNCVACRCAAQSLSCDNVDGRLRKTYTTENAYLSHLNSRRHRENEVKPMFQRTPSTVTQAREAALDVPDDADDQTVNAAIDARISAAAPQLEPTACLFCSFTGTDVSANLAHMRTEHSFVLPHSEELVDIPGVLSVLAAKIVLAQTCIACAREFRTVDAVRRHMTDKSHARLPFESVGDREEFAPFYNFVAVDWDGSGHMHGDDTGDDAEESDLLDNPVLDDDPYTLRLPTGERIGHRSLARYYKQRLTPLLKPAPRDQHLPFRALLADKNNALIPARGGSGGRIQVMKARNAGEALHASDHILSHRDQRRREDFRTRVGFLANHQKHYFDPILGHTGS